MRARPCHVVMAAMAAAAGCGSDPPRFCNGGDCFSQETHAYFEALAARPLDLVVVMGSSGLSFEIDRGGCLPPGGTTISVVCATLPM